MDQLTKKEENFDLFNVNVQDFGKNMIEYVQNFQIMTPEDKKFWLENKERIQSVCTKTFMWRTNTQKRSILSDDYHPTLHSKFHQCILENKVFIEQSIVLAKEFEKTKLDMELLQVEIEEIEEKISNSPLNKFEIKKLEIELKRKRLELGHKVLELQQYKVQMEYRMKENKEWKVLEDELIEEMKKMGLSEEEIWNKEYGEIEHLFYWSLNNLKALYLGKIQDSAEVNNLVALARFSINRAKDIGIFDRLYEKCNLQQKKAIEDLDNLSK